MRRVYLTLVVNIIMDIDEGADLDDVLSTMNCVVEDDQADIVSTEITSHQVFDSK